MAVSQQGRDELEDEVHFPRGGRCSLEPRAAGEVAEGKSVLRSHGPVPVQRQPRTWVS